MAVWMIWSIWLSIFMRTQGRDMLRVGFPDDLSKKEPPCGGSSGAKKMSEEDIVVP